jgi:ABC-type transporter Mla maintaining outer membrane lipid asymmetry ATPase subunit MlaF
MTDDRGSGPRQTIWRQDGGDDLPVTIRPGNVAAFPGPSGAGKTTTMRLILGLDYPSAGTVSVNGKSCQRLDSPMREAGALRLGIANLGSCVLHGLVLPTCAACLPSS